MNRLADARDNPTPGSARRFAALALCALAALPALAQEDGAAVEISGWTVSRMRKTRSGASNVVIVQFAAKNVTKQSLASLRFKMSVFEALGNRIMSSRWTSAGTLRPGGSKTVQIRMSFVPIFGAYELEINYRAGGKSTTKKLMGSNPALPPDIPVDQLIPKQSNVVVLGQDFSYDPRRRLCKVYARLKNLGEVDADPVKVRVTFRNKSGKVVAKNEHELKNRKRKGKPVVGGGEELIYSFQLSRIPKFASLAVAVSHPAVASETALSGGEFTKKADMEVAHIKFERADKSLNVSAKIRNGLSVPVSGIEVVFSFLGYAIDKKGIENPRAPKRTVKKMRVKLKDVLQPQEIKDFAFTIKSMPNFLDYSMDLAFQEGGAGGAGASEAYTQGGELVVNVDHAKLVAGGKRFEATGTIRNASGRPVRDVELTFSLVQNRGGRDVTVKQAKTVVRGPVAPNGTVSFTIVIDKPPKFDSYQYAISFKQ